MAKCVTDNSKILTFYGNSAKEANSIVAVDQHFARALSSKPASPVDSPSDTIKAFRECGYVDFHPNSYRHKNRFHLAGYKRHYAWSQVDHHVPMKRPRFAMPLPPPPPPYMMQAHFPTGPLYGGCMIAQPPAPCMLPAYPGPGWFPNFMDCHPPMQPPAIQHPVHYPVRKQKPPLIFPEFSNSIVQPEVESFSDVPRLPGESCSCANMDEHVTPIELFPEPIWMDTSSSPGVPQAPPPPPLPVAVSSTQLQALMDDLRMTDQELDSILELSGEI